jgi:hypothetical protein
MFTYLCSFIFRTKLRLLHRAELYTFHNLELFSLSLGVDPNSVVAGGIAAGIVIASAVSADFLGKSSI